MRKIVFIGLSSIAALHPVATVAQDAAGAAKAAKTSPYISTVGEVTNIDKAGSKLTIKTNAGESVDVPLGDKTHFLKIAPGETDLKKAVDSSYDALKVGDRVSARSRKLDEGGFAAATTVLVMTKEELAKHQEKTQEEWKTNGLMGTVTVVNPATKEVTIKTAGADGKQIVLEPNDKVNVRRYADDSVKFSDAKASSLVEINVGDTLRVLGTKNSDGTRVKPDEIVYGTFLRKAGTITAIDTASNTVTMKDLSTKKPVLVKLNADTVLKKIPEAMGQMLARAQQGGGRGSAADGASPGGPPAGGRSGAGNFGGAPGGVSASGSPAVGTGADGGGRAGGRGGMGMPRMDPARVLERAPVITIADLKIGDAIMISTSSRDAATLTATTLVAGMEAILAAPSTGRGGGADPLAGSWGMDMGGISQ